MPGLRNREPNNRCQRQRAGTPGLGLAVGLLVVLALVLAACSSGSYNAPAPTSTSAPAPTPGPGGAVAQVILQNLAFQPQQITVKTGTTVTWTNKDSVGHTVTAGTPGKPSGLFDSGNLSGGGTFTFTFKEPGTYDYFCGTHTSMRGVVVVEK